MNSDDDSQKLFNFVTVYGLKPDAKDPNKLAGTLVHCYPQPTPGNEPHTILTEFCFPDIESRTALYRKEQLSQSPFNTTTNTRKSTPLTFKTQSNSNSSSNSNSNSNSSSNSNSVTASNSAGGSGTSTPGGNRTRRAHHGGVYLTTNTFDKAFSPRGSGTRIMSALPAEADITALLLSKRDHRYYAYGRQVTLGPSGRSCNSAGGGGGAAGGGGAGGEHYSYEQVFCVCIVTRHGWGPCFREVLGWLAVRLATLGWEGVVELAQALEAVGMPRHGMGVAVRVAEKPLLPDVYSFVRPNELFKPASENAGSLVAALGPNGITELFVALLFERRVVIVSSDFDKLSRCVLAAYDMTWPFTWHYPCITVNKNKINFNFNFIINYIFFIIFYYYYSY